MPIKSWDVNVHDIIISRLVEEKKNSKYLTGYLDEVMRPLVLISRKMSGHVKIIKDKGRDKNKNKKLMSLVTDDNKLLE